MFPKQVTCEGSSPSFVFSHSTKPSLHQTFCLPNPNSTKPSLFQTLTLYQTLALPNHRSTKPSLYQTLTLLNPRSTKPSLYRTLTLPSPHSIPEPSLYRSLLPISPISIWPRNPMFVLCTVYTVMSLDFDKFNYIRGWYTEILIFSV